MCTHLQRWCATDYQKCYRIRPISETEFLKAFLTKCPNPRETGGPASGVDIGQSYRVARGVQVGH